MTDKDERLEQITAYLDGLVCDAYGLGEISYAKFVEYHAALDELENLENLPSRPDDFLKRLLGA